MTASVRPLIKNKTKLFPCLAPSFNSWATAIRSESCPYKSLGIFIWMHRQAIPLDSFSLLYTLKSAASLCNLLLIRHLHSLSVKLGLSENVYVATSLLAGYAMVSLRDAGKLFDEMPNRTTVSWNAMITGCLRNGDVKRASDIFKAMPSLDVASWSTMIAGHVNNGKCVTGLGVFREMMFSGKLKPDPMTLVSVLLGCSRMGAVGLLVGKSVHGFMVKNVWNITVESGTALVDMYARCGFMKYANRVFELMQEKNVVTWTALIRGSAQHGYSNVALALFQNMQESMVKPNEITFTAILHTCANSGLVHEGRKYFKMIEEYGLELNIHHLGCMVDLLGKAGLVEEAYEVIRSMRVEPNVVIWGSFLSACKEHRKLEMAERVMEEVLRSITPENDGGVYSLISDMYARNQKWDAAEKMRQLMLDNHVRKARGSSLVRIA